MTEPKRCGWFFVWEINWRKWEIGVALSLGAWWPREYSVGLYLGPLLLQGGWEHDDN